jgi:hypothetical protein
MSNVYSLDQLRSDLDKEFAPLVVDIGGGEVTLQNVMRLGVEDRSAVSASVSVVTSDDTAVSIEDRFEAMQTIFEKVTAGGKGKALVKAVGDDYQAAMKILSLWTEATQPGEASNSPA